MSETKQASKIIIPEEFEIKRGVTPSYFGQVSGTPKGRTIGWPLHPSSDGGAQLSSMLMKGFTIVTKKEFKESGMVVTGGYADFDTQNGRDFVTLGDTVMVWITDDRKKQKVAESNARNAFFEGGSGTQEINGEEIQSDTYEGALSGVEPFFNSVST